MSKTLLRGGTVLSMDPEVGDLDVGDVLIEDGAISAVQPSIEADAEAVDCTGKILIPGFIDSHRHTWEAAIRGCAPNATLDDYFVEVLDTFAPLYQPEDVYASNLAGSLRSTRTRRSARCRRRASARSTPTAAPTRPWRSTGSSVPRPSPTTT